VFPGTIVAATNVSGSGLEVYATVNGDSFAVLMVNYTPNAASGQVALSHWPVSTSGTGSIRYWELSGANKQGIMSTVAVTAGMTASISVPAESVVMLYP
jgi:hypothetical protein